MAERGLRSREPLPLVLVRPGQVVIHQGERGFRMFRIEAGILRATTTDTEGRSLIVDVVGPGDVIGEPSGAESAVTVRSDGPARLRQARGDELVRTLAERARRREALASDLAWLEVPERVWRRMDDLASRFGRPTPDGVEITVRLTQESIAQMAGTSRESANRAVQHLIAQGRLAPAGRGRYVVGRALRVVEPSGSSG